MAASFTEGMAKSILNNEDSSARFEKFCCELYSRVDDCIYVGTSWNYDQGRDGRRASQKGDGHPATICVSVRKDSIKKTEEDATKLAVKPFPPKSVRMCLLLEDAKDATEHLLDKVKEVFYEKVPGVESVSADGAIQIAQLAVKYADVFERFYLADLENLRNALRIRAGKGEQIEMAGLRIALTTQFADDANVMREDLQRNLILSGLIGGRAKLNDICKRVSDSLRLPRQVRPEYLVNTLEAMQKDGLIDNSGGYYEISSAGLAQVEKRTDEGAENLINGQQLLRALIFELSGEDIAPKDFSTIWNIVQDEIANMFLENGIYIVRSIESMIKKESQIKDHPDLHDSIKRLAQRVAALKMWGAQADDIYQAILDLFQENESEAFKWLAQLGTVYISLCSLGLDASAQNQIEERLRNIELLLDTDIVLSYLCVGEAKHEAVKSVISTWQKISGNIYVTASVLEECAYHAWISHLDYDDIWRDLPNYSDQDAHRLINNAFVRGFRLEGRSLGKYSRRYWDYYISNYKGQEAYDYSKIEGLLKESYIFKTGDDGINEEFARQVEMAMVTIKMAAGGGEYALDEENIDKCRRDGLLMAVLLRHRQNSKGRNALVVSSSTQLCSACHGLMDKLGPLEPVAPIGALAYLLTMVPGVQMSLGTLRNLMFDTGYARKIRGLDRIALRIIHSSEEYFLPFSKRETLRRKLVDQIGRVATQEGRKPKDVQKEFEERSLETTSMTFIVGGAIDAVVASESEKRIREQEAEIKRLKGIK